jgi:hypothetical protein
MHLQSQGGCYRDRFKRNTGTVSLGLALNRSGTQTDTAMPKRILNSHVRACRGIVKSPQTPALFESADKHDHMWI